jgi:copper resistance protein B
MTSVHFLRGALPLVVLLASAAVATAGDLAAMPSTSGTPDAMPPVMDQSIFGHLFFDQLEGRFGDSTDFRWDGQGWLGTDYDKLWVKSEGFVHQGRVEDGIHELLYDRAVSTYFDVQAGIRSDIDSYANRTWGALGVQGLAPLFFDVEATAYASGDGHFAGKVRASYDLLLTQRLILQPEIEANVYSKSDPRRLVGAGLSDIDSGLRLRYEISRQFAPYIGVAYEGKYGETAAFARRSGQNPNLVRFVFGVRSWF